MSLHTLRPAVRQLRTLRAVRAHSTHGSSASFDPLEVSHFNALASEWWDPHGSSRLLHLMNPLRLQFLSSCLSKHGDATKNMKYLDVGCGGGILAESLARLKGTESVIGVDPTPEVLKIARGHMRQDPALQGRLRYVGATIDTLEKVLAEEEGRELKEGWEGERTMFDVVTTMEVVEHVPHPTRFLKECMQHVRPGGWVVGSTIARTWTSYLTTKLVAEDILGIVPMGTHDWNKYVNANELDSFFRGQDGWGGKHGEDIVFLGCAYIPGLGWKMVPGGEKVGNYFFGIRRNSE